MNDARPERVIFWLDSLVYSYKSYKYGEKEGQPLPGIPKLLKFLRHKHIPFRCVGSQNGPLYKELQPDMLRANSDLAVIPYPGVEQIAEKLDRIITNLQIKDIGIYLSMYDSFILQKLDGYDPHYRDPEPIAERLAGELASLMHLKYLLRFIFCYGGDGYKLPGAKLLLAAHQDMEMERAQREDRPLQKTGLKAPVFLSGG